MTGQFQRLPTTSPRSSQNLQKYPYTPGNQAPSPRKMPETFSMPASVATVVQLAGQVTALGYVYIGRASRTPKGLQTLLGELYSLGEALISLQDYAGPNPNTKVLQALDLQTLNGQHEVLRCCAEELRGLREKLKPKCGLRGVINDIRWQLSRKNTLQHITQIKGCKNLLTLALRMSQMAMKEAVGASTGEAKDFEATDRVAQAWSTPQSSGGQEIDFLVRRHNEVINWISREDFGIRHIEVSSARQDGTGDWLLGSRAFGDWTKGQLSSRLLWGYGIPGTGKTFLCSLVIDYLQESLGETCGVAYIYFDHKEQEKQTPEWVITSLLKQLASKKQHLPVYLELLYKEFEGSRESVTTRDLYTSLLKVKAGFLHKVFLVFDALDECNPPKQRRELLSLFLQMEKDGFNIFLTSQPHLEDIQSSLSNAIKIELSAHEEDMTAYIRERISENSCLRCLKGGYKDKITSEIIDYAKGIFLLVRLHVDYLCQQVNLKQILAVLGELKGSVGKRALDSAYKRAIEYICRQDTSSVDLAFSILSWLVTSKRALTVEELRVAVAIEEGRHELDDMDLPDRATLVDVCAGLVVICESSDTIRLAHYTAHEYLVENYIVSTDAELRLAIACTTYLSFDSLAMVCVSTESLLDRLNSHPLLEYAAKFLDFHIKSCDQNLTTDVLLSFFKTGNIDCYHQVLTAGRRDPIWFPLHIASRFGHLRLIQLLLEQGANISATRSRQWTPLHEAALGGQEAAAHLLLENGADFSPTGDSVWTPSHIAAFGGHKKLVRLLLENGADLSAIDIMGRTLLHWAAHEGHEKVVRLLLDSGADVLAVDNDGLGSLHLAALEGHKGVLHLLLENGADTLAVDRWGRTLLHYAVSSGDENVVQLVLENGVGPLAVDTLRMTPLHVAVSGGDEKVVQLLLESGADISATGGWDRKTSLHWAVEKGHEEVAQLLLENGAEISATDSNNMTSLQLAVVAGYENMTRLLLENGADTSATDDMGMTPLQQAANEGYEGVVRLLLESGADTSVAGADRKTPLYFASVTGYKEIARLLVENGADILAVCYCGKTPLQWATSSGHEEVVQLLLESGADISNTDYNGETLLHLAVRGGYEQLARLLLENGIDISATDSDGRTALHWAVLRGHEGMAQLLLEGGADLSVADNDGDTPLYWVASGDIDQEFRIGI